MTSTPFDISMWQNLSFNRTRLAPTPSGYLHLGNLASFILTCRIARLCKAKIFLRIDDLDQSRVRDEYLQDIFETLSFMELPWDEGPRTAEEFKTLYSQTHRKVLYQEALDHLAKNRSVFGCRCSRSQLHSGVEQDGYPGTCLKINIPLNESGISWRLHQDDKISLCLFEAGGAVQEGTLPAGKINLQVKRKEGDASYQLSSVVDDIHFGTDLIVRGNDLLDSSWAQLHLSHLLPPNKFPHVRFLHHPLLTDEEGRKLSKTAGDIAVKTLRERGKTAQEILHLIGRRLGSDSRFHDWQELGDWMLAHWIK